MYPSSYRTHLHPKSPTSEHKFWILPNPVLEHRELNLVVASTIQVRSYHLLPRLSTLIGLRCSLTHVMELEALWSLGTRLSCRNTLGHCGPSKPIGHR
jgi:hypothetical protein